MEDTTFPAAKRRKNGYDTHRAKTPEIPRRTRRELVPASIFSALCRRAIQETPEHAALVRCPCSSRRSTPHTQSQPPTPASPSLLCAGPRLLQRRDFSSPRSSPTVSKSRPAISDRTHCPPAPRESIGPSCRRVRAPENQSVRGFLRVRYIRRRRTRSAYES